MTAGLLTEVRSYGISNMTQVFTEPIAMFCGMPEYFVRSKEVRGAYFKITSLNLTGRNSSRIAGGTST
jgi:hypothetical protein